MPRSIPGNSGGPSSISPDGSSGSARPRWRLLPKAFPPRDSGFAIPAETVRTSVAQFKEVAQNKPPPERQALPKTKRPASQAQRLFGLQLQDLTPDLTDALGYVQGRGVLVSAVEPDSPADRAGIQRGLVIYRVGRYNVSSIKQLESLLARVGIRHQRRFHGRRRARQRPGPTSGDCSFDRAVKLEEISQRNAVSVV